MGKIEDDYLDVLQNIEFAIVTIYHQYPEITDYDVESAVNALIREYRAQESGRTVASPKIGSESQSVYDSVKMMCEWRLGKESLVKKGEFAELGDIAPLTNGEIVGCLKRIRKSIGRWSKEGGRQGYLQFIVQYVR